MAVCWSFPTRVKERRGGWPRWILWRLWRRSRLSDQRRPERQWPGDWIRPGPKTDLVVGDDHSAVVCVLDVADPHLRRARTRSTTVSRTGGRGVGARRLLKRSVHAPQCRQLPWHGQLVERIRGPSRSLRRHKLPV